MTKLALVERLYVTTKYFYVVKELARGRRIFVMRGDFYVTTELAMTKSSATDKRAGCAKASAHDSVTSCCVAIEEAKRAQ